MTEALVSVVVVSRGRPDALQRCLQGLEQLFYTSFEIVVVTDPSGLKAVTAPGFEDRIKCVAFGAANISMARNLGIAEAAGDIVAFIDDDAVPEPTWLTRLVAPFEETSVHAATGYVRGRNGISFQSRATRVNGKAHEQAVDETGLCATHPGNAMKTVGTNCAFRRETLAEIGGFDPNYRFYLDETDVNMRLAKDSRVTAVVPDAEVHHGFHASAHRTASRMPKTLYEIGASLAVFLRKHNAGALEPRLQQERDVQRARLIRHMNAGNCEPRDVARLMATLENGFTAGQFRPLIDPPRLEAPGAPFKPFVPRVAFQGSQVIAGSWRDTGLRAKAQSLVGSGMRVSLFLFSPTALFHRVSFQNGVWIQRGGVFGKSDRSDPIFKFWSRTERLDRERMRVESVRGLADC
ncbi:MAG: glycosyltransferase family A protein [Pseudomonadota bacterium]